MSEAGPNDGKDSNESFEAPVRAASEMLHVVLKGYEGPLDVLLELARREKIDLSTIAILPLAEQFLAFVAEAKAQRVELAADILVMAAWLAWLKSRLIAPADEAGPDGEELAEELAFRLRRLEAMREAAETLFARPRLGLHVFARGDSDAPAVERTVTYRASLYDLLAAYGAIRQGEIADGTYIEKRSVFSLVDAKAVMERVIGRSSEWLPLGHILAAMPAGQDPRAVLASTFGATLEMARDGRLSVRQSGPFAPLYVKAENTRPEDSGAHGDG